MSSVQFGRCLAISAFVVYEFNLGQGLAKCTSRAIELRLLRWRS
jgi:hypothetical protein